MNATKAPDKKTATGKKSCAGKKTAPAPKVAKLTDTLAPTDKINQLVEKNPKRPGSAAHKRFALYANHKTVVDFLKAGGTAADLRYDVKHGFIKIGG